MTRIRKFLIWAIVGGACVVSVGYFLANIWDPSFRNSAMGNLFATLIGVLVGIPVALEINRRQQHAHERRDTEQRRTEDEAWLKSIMKRVNLELASNRGPVEYLQAALSETPRSRVDLWEWAITIVDSFAFSAYEDLQSPNLRRLLPFDVEFSLSQAYQFLHDLSHRVRQGSAAHSFFLGYTADEKRADSEMDFVRDLARETHRAIDTAQDQICRHRLMEAPQT